MDGSGYPQGLTGDRIHRISRIVAVADVYDALLADRPWRAALLPYKAMEVVLLLVNEGKLDGEVVRAFLETVSLFPLGSWVELTDDRLGRVVAANRGEHTRPVVAMLFGRDGKPLEAPERVDLALRRDIAVARPQDGDDLAVSTVEGW
jgi:HD-GYP domain-containing protein (c-di-GMP phosphodiesterase class II)